MTTLTTGGTTPSPTPSSRTAGEVPRKSAGFKASRRWLPSWLLLSALRRRGIVGADARTALHQWRQGRVGADTDRVEAVLRSTLLPRAVRRRLPAGDVRVTLTADTAAFEQELSRLSELVPRRVMSLTEPRVFWLPSGPDVDLAKGTVLSDFVSSVDAWWVDLDRPWLRGATSGGRVEVAEDATGTTLRWSEVLAEGEREALNDWLRSVGIAPEDVVVPGLLRVSRDGLRLTYRAPLRDEHGVCWNDRDDDFAREVRAVVRDVPVPPWPPELVRFEVRRQVRDGLLAAFPELAAVA